VMPRCRGRCGVNSNAPMADPEFQNHVAELRADMMARALGQIADGMTVHVMRCWKWVSSCTNHLNWRSGLPIWNGAFRRRERE
jgi:hypothetical protein